MSTSANCSRSCTSSLFTSGCWISPTWTSSPRTFLFGAKSASGYARAKLIIKLINSVADVVNQDPIVAGRLKVVFPPNFNVTMGQIIYPGAELSEQISLAGKEASGTGNMKFALNGALTIGTLDGANIEIRDLVGADNFFLFGLNTDEVFALRAQGYQPSAWYQANPVLKRVGRQHRHRRFFAARARPLPPAHGITPPARRVHGAGRLPGLYRLPGAA